MCRVNYLWHHSFLWESRSQLKPPPLQNLHFVNICPQQCRCPNRVIGISQLNNTFVVQHTEHKKKFLQHEFHWQDHTIYSWWHMARWLNAFPGNPVHRYVQKTHTYGPPLTVVESPPYSCQIQCDLHVHTIEQEQFALHQNCLEENSKTLEEVLTRCKYPAFGPSRMEKKHYTQNRPNTTKTRTQNYPVRQGHIIIPYIQKLCDSYKKYMN